MFTQVVGQGAGAVHLAGQQRTLGLSLVDLTDQGVQAAHLAASQPLHPREDGAQLGQILGLHHQPLLKAAVHLRDQVLTLLHQGRRVLTALLLLAGHPQQAAQALGLGPVEVQRKTPGLFFQFVQRGVVGRQPFLGDLRQFLQHLRDPALGQRRGYAELQPLEHLALEDAFQRADIHALRRGAALGGGVLQDAFQRTRRDQVTQHLDRQLVQAGVHG